MSDVLNTCGRQCFIIGGPWIAEDPDCPVHGAVAVRAAREALMCIRDDLEPTAEKLAQWKGLLTR